ncbi:MAG: choice-of-anchor B family protein [Bacteroidota bacterium]
MLLQSTWNGSPLSYNDVWGYVDFSGKEYAIIGSQQKVHFLEVTNPTNPVLVDEFSLGSNTSWRDIKTFNHYVYAVSEGFTKEGLAIFDLCGIEQGKIKLVSQQNTVFGKAHNLFVDTKNERLYVVGSDTQSRGIIIYDLSENPENPTVLASTTLPGGYIHDVFIQNNLAFCSHGYNGLYVYDVTDPSNIVFKASIETGGYNHSSWILQDGKHLVYAQEIPTGLPLGMLNYEDYESNDLELITNFKKPLLAPEHTGSTPHNPYVVGDYAVVSYYEDGVVLFDVSNPTQPDTVAYFDTYPSNETYTGYAGCWGVYPFLPSGNILASDISNGLFVLKPNFTLKNNCNNGVQDWNEENIDCGGVCQLCTPCYLEICDNQIDDDRNGQTDCEDIACDCTENQGRIDVTVFIEGFFNQEKSTTEMATDLVEDGLVPNFQPFKTKPYYYAGREQTTTLLNDVVDWVLLEARHPELLDSVLARSAALLLKNGKIRQMDGTMGVDFGSLPVDAIHLVIRHKSHLAVMSSDLIQLSSSNVTYDFTKNGNTAMGTNQLKEIAGKFCLHAGDFDQNGNINSLDFNIWKQNSALVNRYLSWDADGNGVINNQDFNYWKINRSKLGEPSIRLATE